jgi:hypothetical protein
MKWIGQHIYDLASRFRNDVFLEDISTGTIASGAHLGLDSNNKIVKAVDGGGDLTSIVAGTGLSGTSLTGPIPTLNVDAAQTGITSLGTLSGLAIGGDLTVTGDNIIFQSANADDPLVTIKNTSNAANDMARLNFVKERDGGTAAANDNCAEIRFLSKDASGNEQQYGLIISEIDVATHGQESGVLRLGVASHDGGNSYGLQITGGSVDNEVDVLLGTGAASETTITGTLTMGSTATIDNSGAWVGGVIPSAKLDADTAHLSVDNVFTGATQTITSDGGGRPSMVIQNTGNNADGGFLQFKLDKGAVGADDDRPGNIQWQSDNDAQQQSIFGTIYTLVSDATDGQEAGDMHLQVASYDGTLRSGLYLDGDTNAAGEVDVTIAAGAASITTIAGTLTMGSTAALTNAGLVAVANQSNITGLGTISSGVWNGDDIPVANGGTGASNLDAFCLLAGSQTLTGTKTLNSFKGTGATTVTNILDEDAMGSDSATALATQQSIKAYADRPAKQIVLKNFNFVASSGTTETFFPFAGTAEKTSDTDAAIVMIAPTAGKLLKLYMRASRDHSGQTTTITLYNWDADEVFSSGNKSSLGVQSATGPNTNEVVTFDFTSSLDSGTNAFTALETLAISYDNASAIGGGNTKYFFTAVFEYDFSGY